MAAAAKPTSCWIDHIKEFFTGDIVQLQCIKDNSKKACQHYVIVKTGRCLLHFCVFKIGFLHPVL